MTLPAQYGARMSPLGLGQWGLSSEKSVDTWEISGRTVPGLDQRSQASCETSSLVTGLPQATSLGKRKG